MSQHPSLKSASKDKKQRCVLNRFEKIKALKEKGEWKEGDSIFGLPKVKVAKIKLKKEKPKEAEEKKTQEEQQEQPEKKESQDVENKEK